MQVSVILKNHNQVRQNMEENEQKTTRYNQGYNQVQLGATRHDFLSKFKCYNQVNEKKYAKTFDLSEIKRVSKHAIIGIFEEKFWGKVKMQDGF